MKTLLITYYWHPYLSPGALRWLGFGGHMDFDVLTCWRPLRDKKDETMPSLERKVLRFGYRIPAIIWGVLATLPALFMKRDLYIFTAPPEALFIPAWILQKLGRKVLLDLRDSITRERRPHKWLTGLWIRIYSQISQVVVCARIVDQGKRVIYHGHDGIRRDSRAMDPPVYYSSQVNYETYMLLLRHGFIKDFSGKPWGYGASSYHNIRHLGYEVNISLAEDEYGQHSWEEEAGKLKEIIKKIMKC